MLVADLQAVALCGLYVAGVSLAFWGNRTMLHVGMANLVWFAPLFHDRLWALAGLGVLLALALAAHLRRPAAWEGVLAGERDFGPVTFFLGLFLVVAPWALLDMGFPFVAAAIVPLAFGDPVGFYVGRARGRHRLPNGKSVEGFLGVAVAGFAALVVYAVLAGGTLPAPRALLWLGGVALAAAAAETLAPRHLDNVLMPVAGLGAGVGLAALVGAA